MKKYRLIGPKVGIRHGTQRMTTVVDANFDDYNSTLVRLYGRQHLARKSRSRLQKASRRANRGY